MQTAQSNKEIGARGVRKSEVEELIADGERIIGELEERLDSIIECLEDMDPRASIRLERERAAVEKQLTSMRARRSELIGKLNCFLQEA